MGGCDDAGNGGGLDSLWFQLVTYSAVASEVLLFFLRPASSPSLY